MLYSEKFLYTSIEYYIPKFCVLGSICFMIVYDVYVYKLPNLQVFIILSIIIELLCFCAEIFTQKLGYCVTKVCVF